MSRDSSPSKSPTPDQRYQYVWNAFPTTQLPPPGLSDAKLAPLLRFNNSCFSLVADLLGLRDLVHLKCVGCPLLWKKIEVSCRTVAFTPITGQNRRVAPIIFIDPFRVVTGFSHLETLLLDRLHWSSSYGADSPLKSLPPTLQTLLISVVSSGDFVSLSQIFDVGVASRFPLLQQLSIHLFHRIPRTQMLGVAWLDSLPDTLRVLSVVCCLEHPSDCLAYLNQGSLENNTSSNGRILPMLEVLQMDSDLDEFSPIPDLNPSIRVLRLVIRREFGTCELLPQAPISEPSYGGGLEDFRYETKVGVTTDQLAQLPRPTLRLALVVKGTQLSQFPACPPLDPNLRFLELSGVNLPIKEENMPHTLEALIASHFDEHFLSGWLKKTTRLKRLSTSSGWISVERLSAALPPTLKHLSCLLIVDGSREHQALFRSLPKGLEIFEFTAVGFWESAYASLPSSLLELHIYAVTFWGANGLAPELMLRTTPKLNVLIATAPGKTNSFKFTELKLVPACMKYMQLPGIMLSPTPVPEEELIKRIRAVSSLFPPSCICDIPFQVGRTPVAPSVLLKSVDCAWPAL